MKMKLNIWVAVWKPKLVGGCRIWDTYPTREVARRNVAIRNKYRTDGKMFVGKVIAA